MDKIWFASFSRRRRHRDRCPRHSSVVERPMGPGSCVSGGSCNAAPATGAHRCPAGSDPSVGGPPTAAQLSVAVRSQCRLQCRSRGRDASGIQRAGRFRTQPPVGPCGRSSAGYRARGTCRSRAPSRARYWIWSSTPPASSWPTAWRPACVGVGPGLAGRASWFAGWIHEPPSAPPCWPETDGGRAGGFW